MACITCSRAGRLQIASTARRRSKAIPSSHQIPSHSIRPAGASSGSRRTVVVMRVIGHNQSAASVRSFIHRSTALRRRLLNDVNTGTRFTASVAYPQSHSTAPYRVVLSELIAHYLPSRTLRSSNTYLLARPSGITSNFTSRAFSVSAPSTWNSLPAHIRSLDNLSTFKRQLKSHVFQFAFAV